MLAIVRSITKLPWHTLFDTEESIDKTSGIISVNPFIYFAEAIDSLIIFAWISVENYMRHVVNINFKTFQNISKCGIFI